MGDRSRRDGENIKFINLKINGDGVLYESKKAPEEGFNQHVSKTGQVSYWKLYKYGVDGWLKMARIRDVEFDDIKFQSFEIGIYDDGEMYVISMPLFTQKGGLNNYAKSFICQMPNIDISRKIAVCPSTKKREGTDFPIGLLGMFYPDPEDYRNNELIKYYYKRGENGLPDGKETIKMGKKTWDFSEQNEFLYDKLMEFLAKFNESKETNNTPVQEDAHRQTDNYSAPASPAYPEDIPVNNDDDEDSLPF